MSPAAESSPTTVTHNDKTIEVLEQNVQILESSLDTDKVAQPVEEVAAEPSLSPEEEAAAYQMSAEEIKAAVAEIIKKKHAAAAVAAKEKSRLESIAAVTDEAEQTEEQVSKLNLIFLQHTSVMLLQFIVIHQ